MGAVAMGEQKRVRNTSGLGKKGVPTTDAVPVMGEAFRLAIADDLAILQTRPFGADFSPEQDHALLRILAAMDGNLWRTSKLVGIPVGTIWKVKERHQGEFAEARSRWKKAHASRAADLADMMAAKLAEKVETDDVSLRDMAVAWGITVQRGGELAGDGITIRHEHHHSADPALLAAMRERTARLLAADAIIDVAAESVDIGPAGSGDPPGE